MIDLRSDTVTRPTAAMREAIAAAEVGDDVFDDDPTVHRLQDALAERFGKEAALFVPSGTMANQVTLMCWCRPGDHVLVPRGAHVVHYEGGAGAALAGVQFTELGQPSARGHYDLDVLERAIQPDDHHHSPTRLVTIESTHNQAGGAVVALEHLRALRELTTRRELPLHLDGARLFNALIAAGQDAAEVGGCVDSLGVCLSKGLGAPIGSVLLGSRAFIDRAHRYRKMLGGAMRQVGLLAAAGLHALEHHVERLADDHRRAAELAAGLARLGGVDVDPLHVETNIVYFELGAETGLDGAAFVRECAARGVLCYATGPQQIRWVTHLDVGDGDVERALEVAAQVLAAR